MTDQARCTECDRYYYRETCGCVEAKAAAYARIADDDVLADLERFGRSAFLEVDASIRIHKVHNIEEPWNTWHYPRCLAALATPKEATR